MSDKLTKEELAAVLDGREYQEEITHEEVAAAKADGLVVVFGTSDDLIEFRGAIHDEAGCSGGATVMIDFDGVLPAFEDAVRDGEAATEHYFIRKARARSIEALWCKEDGYSWAYKTDIPHATFCIEEDDELYCRGIVFALADLQAVPA